MNDTARPICITNAERDHAVLERLGFIPIAAQLNPETIAVYIHVLDPDDKPQRLCLEWWKADLPLVEQVSKLYGRAVGKIMQERLTGYADLYHGQVEGMLAAHKATRDQITAAGGTILPAVPTLEVTQEHSALLREALAWHTGEKLGR